MTTVAILGAGDIAGAAAYALASRDRVARILLLDGSGKVAAGKALDIMQSAPVAGFHARLEGSDDLSRLTGCDVCVVADRFGPSSTEWQGEEGLSMLTRIAPYLSDAPLVFAGVQQTTLIEAAVREARLAPRRLIGSAPEAFVSAVRAIVAMEARCSPREVTLTVLGTPPSTFVIPWSEASIGGYALERVLEQVQLTRIEARAARLWPPAAYALGTAAALTTEAIVESSRSSLAVLTMLQGEFGASNRAGVVPALLSTSGIVHTRIPVLNTRERVLLGTALGI
jgi:malate dehydrogenase